MTRDDISAALFIVPHKTAHWSPQCGRVPSSAFKGRANEAVACLTGAATTWPFIARAQPRKMRTIGVLVGAAPGWQRFWKSFPEALREFGYIEGQNVRFEFRSDEGQISGLANLATELARLKVNVIVPWFTPAAVAAKHATPEIPIVCALCGDMVGTGLVESLARPGGNVTGISSLNSELAARALDLVREMVPSAHRIAVLANAPDPFSKQFIAQIQRASEATGTAIDPIMIHSAEELDAAFPAMQTSRADAVIVQPSLPTKRVAELALSHRIPAICTFRDFAYDGGLMAYFADEQEMYRGAAVLVDKILRGAKPAELPVEQPTRFELAINRKTAKTLGLQVPDKLLALADEVIE
jgi:putative tryptophan/tyrosine transport system substrate-binding protein